MTEYERVNGYKHKAMSGPGAMQGKIERQLLWLHTLLVVNAISIAFFCWTAYRWNRKMAVADRVMAAQQERTTRYLAAKDCGRLLATLDTAALMVRDDVPSSLSEPERIAAFRAALHEAIPGVKP